MTTHPSDRRTVQYRGHVQGVGFRYTAQKLARSRAVTGYVRNLPNGNVELVVEGDREAIDSLLSAIDERMAGYISDRQMTKGPATGEFDGFDIRR